MSPLHTISILLPSLLLGIVLPLHGQSRVGQPRPENDDQGARPANPLTFADQGQWLARIAELQPRSLALPYELDESSIILPPGAFLEEDLARQMLGGTPYPWHVWLVGQLRPADSTLPLILKFEGPSGDYVDIYVMIVCDSAGSRLRSELLGVFASAVGRIVTSRARINEDMSLSVAIDW